MPAGITVNGVDLDDIFKTRTSTKIADVEFEVGGVDISNRYEPINTNPKSKLTYNTGYIANGVDLRELFMQKAFNPFNITLSFSIVQYSADCWQIYISGQQSRTCKLNFRFLNQGAKEIWFNPTDAKDGYRRFNVVNQGNGQGAMSLDSVSFYNSNGTLFATYGIGKGFSVPSNNWRGDGSTTSRFTISDFTVSNKGIYTLGSNLYTSNNATAVFTVKFASDDEIN